MFRRSNHNDTKPNDESMLSIDDSLLTETTFTELVDSNHEFIIGLDDMARMKMEEIHVLLPDERSHKAAADVLWESDDNESQSGKHIFVLLLLLLMHLIKMSVFDWDIDHSDDVSANTTGFKRREDHVTDD